jgi:hypothetical protein
MDNLLRILNISLLEDNEADVTGLVFAILGEAGKDYRNGYLVRTEHRISRNIPADVTIEILRNGENILVVECKRNISLFNKGEIQVEGHMINGEYPHGLLICGQVSRFYRYDIIGESGPIEDGQYNNPIEIEHVINKIKEF